MKFTLVLLIVAAFVGCVLSWSCTDDSWSQFKSTFNKNYPEPSEDHYHRDIYCDRLTKIDAHNAKFQRGESTYKQGVNKFADMGEKERSEWMR